ncbi:Adenine-specific DNA methylase, N12 class [Gemmobacter megaterium]|uniref:Adenine-specific DNA methylase, N12 class n=1 Tax=Gemmobacter megaterium TaxID=1086013 RepID=A0A1N7QB30_9RHOB|nr:PLxRFG domain-containing protein [Gemmobacter megaterium]GGE24354.1 hypothetical protein GCM10011345_32910 [Gemmobacter megaterium]SIT19939.1 Adenine-specific DNA methylase, N12 class [Gemmobacter megaterium]
MAGNIFAGDLVQPLGAKRQSADADPKVSLNRIAAKHRIPANAILAVLSTDKDRSEARAEALAAEMAAQVKAGRGIEDVLRERGGDDLLDVAYRIADELDPQPKAATAKDGPSLVKDLGAGALGAAVRGVGGAIDYAGNLADRALNSDPAQRIIQAATGRQEPLGAVATRLTDPASKAVKGAGEGILSAVSPEARAASEKTLPTGDPLDPSTWKAPEDFSWRGLAQVSAEGLGSLAPVVATAIATRGSSLAAASVGGAMAGGEGRETAAQVIDDLWKAKGEDGTPELARQSDVFRELTAQGMDPNAAYQETRRRAMDAAGDIQAMIGGAGGAITGGLVAKGLPQSLAGKSLAGNVARGVAVGATEEGLQEGLESTGARIGINRGAGTSLNPTEGAIEAAAAGALAGGPMGALGARRPQQEPQPEPEAPTPMLALPAPMLELPSPVDGGTVFADGASAPDGTPPASQPAGFRPQSAYPGDGSAGGQTAAPDSPPVSSPSGVGAAVDEIPPAGPIEAAARLAPDLTPQPEPVPAPQMFPDQKPGGAVRVYDDEAGLVRDVVFQRETPDGNVVIRVDGVEIDLDPVAFDTARRQAADMDKAAEQATKSKPKDQEQPTAQQPAAESEAKPAPAQSTPMPSPTQETLPAAPETEALSQQALGKVKPPKEKKPKQPVTPDEAIRQMRQMEDRAREGGWTGPMKRKYDALGKIAETAPQFDQDTGEITDPGTEPEAAPTRPRPTVEPIRTPPEQRVQPDMLGGKSVTEADMAAKERRRREWGRVLGVASGRSSDDTTLEGRDVLIRPNKIVIRATPNGRSDLDYTIDTDGMDRDTIAARMRGALQELDRVAPLPKPATVKQSLTDEQAGPGASWVIRNRETGETVMETFDRKKVDALNTAKYEAVPAREHLESLNRKPTTVADSKPAQGDPQTALPPTNEPQKPVPTREQFEAAAAETNPDPTPAQKEAENYKTAKIDWQGMRLSIENAKGSERKGTSPDGTEWKVTMPAEYGRILRTTGADGDHVDFYMGPNTASESVWVVDQIDPDSGTFDEHKVMLGFDTPADAKATYQAGFSDGRGAARIGGIRKMALPEFKAWLDSGETDTPVSGKAKAGGKISPPPASSESISPVIENIREKAAVLRGVPKDQPPAVSGVSLKWDDKEGGFIFSRKHADKVRDAVMPKPAPKEGTPGVLILNSLQTGKTRIVDTGPSQPRRPGAADVKVENEGEHSVAFRLGDAAMIAFPDAASKTLQADVTEVREDMQRQGVSTALHDKAIEYAAERGWRFLSGYELTEDGRAFYDGLKRKGYDVRLVDLPNGERAYEVRRPEAKPLDGEIITPQDDADVRQAGAKVAGIDLQAAPTPTRAPWWDNADKAMRDAILKEAGPKAEREYRQGMAWDGLSDDGKRALTDAFGRLYRAGTLENTGTIEAPSYQIAGQKPAVGLGDLLSGYERTRDAFGEPTTDQARVTDDGYVVKRQVNRTTITDPKGRQIFAGTHNVDEAKIESVIADARKPEQAARRETPVGSKASDAPVPISPQPTGPRRFDWWWTNNRDQRREALKNAGLDTTVSTGLTSGEVADRLTGEQMETLRTAIFGPESAGAQRRKPASGILSALSEDKQKRADELKARLAAKARNQTSSGLDPEYITLGAELVGLYIEAGTKRFGQMLRDFAESTGLTMREAQAPMRAAYNHVRDTMDLDGQDVSDMDDAKAVLDEVRRAMAEAEASQSKVHSEPESRNVGVDAEPENRRDDNRNNASDDRPSPQEGAGDLQAGTGQAGSLRSDDRTAGRPGNRVAERTGERSGPRRDGQRSGDGSGPGNGTGGRGPVNHVIEPGGLELARGEKTRARESIAAIRTLRTIQQEGRPATAEERATLAKYGGAGTLAGTLPRSDGTIRFPDLAAEIETMTTPEERATLSRTSQYAFYTAESALRSMWTLAQQLGFTGGRVYEPGMGVGGFAGTMPGSLNATYTGLELDHITAQIAAALYPRHNIKNGDFIKEKLPQGFYDLVIGNPPFAGTQIKADPDYPQGFFIHDYFFAKSLDAVRPGGVLMFITSAGTMNKMDSKARDYLADRADLVGAIRLPNTAFKENGTEVTTDIIVLRKRVDSEAEANPAWRQSEVIDLPGSDGTTGQAAVNRYFIENPDMILGEQGLYDTLTAGARVGVRPRPNADLRADLKSVLSQFPSNIMSAPPESVKLDALDADHAETKPGSFYLKDGALWLFDGNTGRKVEPRSRENTKGMPKAAMEAVKALIPIKNALRDVYAADVDGKDASAARKALNDSYDAYVKERGPIGLQHRRTQRPSIVEQESARQQAENDARAAGEPFDIGSFDAGPMIEAGASMAEIARARQEARQAPGYREGTFAPEAMDDKIIVTRPNIDPFMDDPESYRLLAIEKYDEKTDTAQKTRVFTENAVRVSSRPQINSPEDALLHLLGETGRVDPGRIAALSNSTSERVISELEGKIFQNPRTREWETRARYLSGNVVVKLEEAEREARANPEYQPNVDALRAVQPAPVAAQDISVPLGAHWFPTSIYPDFAEALGLELQVEFKPRLGIWLVNGTTTGAKATSEFGTEDRPFGELMGLVMANKKVEVRRTRRNQDGSTDSWVDEEATQAATDKANELQTRFRDWFWSDPARTAEMETLYNRTFNAEVAPKYDGEYLTTPGIHSDWSWRPHQTAVIARILQSGDTYMAHTVGAGKTSAMIGAGMEAKRLGLARKPWYTVPNHMLIQFATEFYQQYPLAKVLVADEKRFHTSRRKQFVADAALGDYDAVIITHSAFQLIPASEASKKAAVEGMLQDVRDVLEGLSGGQFGEDAGMERSVLGALHSMAATLGVDVKGITSGETKTRKKIEALLEAAEQRIARQTSDKGKDAVFDFDETGADMLFVDEAHLFRKLSFATSLGSIKGVDPQGSQQSMDLFIKTRSLAQRNPGRSLVLASGTPITNTMAELYSISRYLQPQALDDRNISAFDSWAATFGTTENALEQAPDGGYKLVTRFAKFVNTPELSLMVRQVMDVVSSKDLEQYVTRPALKDGKRNLIVVEASPELKAYQQQLGARMRMIENRKGPVKKGDDILLSVINDGRLAAIDMRLVDPSAGENNSKLERMINNIYRRWKEGADAPLYGVKKEGGYTDEPLMRGPTTQMVFSTLGVNPSKHNPSFSVHRFIKAQLVAMGVPADEIILAENLTSDARKQRAFNDMNEGKKRILIGSKTLFTGVNAQRRITAIHNLDPLWFPADDEQRNGRGIRQGNMNREIEILDYSAKGTYDATMWQMMARKAGFIEGFFRGDPNVRDMEDLGEASQYEQAKAMSTADPRVLELTELRAERDKLQRRAGAAVRERQQMEAKARGLGRAIAMDREELTFWQPQAAKVQDLSGDAFEARMGGKTYTERKEFGADLISAAEDALAGTGFRHQDKVGTVSGFPLHIEVSHAMNAVTYYIALPRDNEVMVGWSEDPVGMARKVEGALSKIEATPRRIEADIARRERERADVMEGLAKLKGFADQDKLNELAEKVDALEGALLAENAPDEAKESRFDDQEPAARLTGDELGPWEDMLDLQRKARAWYRDNLQGRKVTNTSTGWEVSFTRAAAGKIGGKPLDYLLRAVPALEQIVASAEKTGESEDRFGRAHVRKIHYFQAQVSVAGRQEPIHIVIREMDNGRMFYDLNLGGNIGAPAQGQMDARETRVEPELQIGADTLNLQLAPPKINAAAVPVDSLRDIARMAEAEVAAAGLAGKVTPRVVRGLLGASGVPIQGRQRGALIELNPAARDARGVMRHEIVHALRDPDLWGQPYGLFTAEEWRALVRAARVDADLMARVERAYGDKVTSVQIEEAVAEMYREWATARDAAGPLARIFNKVRGFLQAIASGLRGQGFVSPALVMERIAGGTVGGRGPDGPGAGRMDDREMRDALMRSGAKAKGLIGSHHWKEPGAFVSSILTDAMVGKGRDGEYNLLSLVPGRPLFMELGKRLVSARAYLRTKEEMDALRNAWHGRADAVAQEWLDLRRKDPRANDDMMDLMHRATLAGVDPSKPLPSDHVWLQRAREELSRRGDSAEAWARATLEAAARKAEAHMELKRAYDALPEPFKAMYGKVLAEYTAIADDFDKAVMENLQNATRIGLKRAERAFHKEARRIQDEGLTGQEKTDALAEAQAKLDAVKARGGFAARARLTALRKMFEQNRMKGPYVPLARFGDYFVTVRNEQGEVMSFSRFERESQQQAFVREQEALHPGRVQHGLVSNKGALRSQVDPTFVADVEKVLAESGANFEVMDAVWQRWLETLPDSSIRTSKVHRKGRAGYNRDAYRAFGKHMFHGAHQLARLKYGILLEDHMDEAELEARKSDNPNRMGAVVREMQRRHDFTMEPLTSAWAAGLTNLAFIWYLGATPAAAVANLTQTTVVGIPLMATRFRKAGVSGVSAELARALRDFSKGRGANWRETWSAANAEGLAQDERDALNEAYRRGTIDKTQAHDLAAVAETGVEYSAVRERVMRKIGWMFHHAERLNREVTFLAGYRLAKADGLSGLAAIDAAADMTWEVHFDYQSSSRPRAMQGDLARIVTSMKNFVVNMLWRLFRDTHQSLHGASKQERAEARSQLIGITLSMMAHAGIRGTWGYGLLMMLLGAFFPGGGDDAEEWLQDALLMEGDTPGVAAWNYAMGMAMSGVPGRVLGADLTERVGMPNLWFRGDDRDLEGQDLYDAHMRELLGPVAGIPLGFYRGLDYIGDGDWWRGIEAAVPKAVRDLMKAGRFSTEGAITRNGDPLIEDVSPYQAIMQASGFTPAQLAERYRINNRLRNVERRITDERKSLHREAGDALRSGQPIPEGVIDAIRDFNMRYPEYPITSDTLRQSMLGRIRASERNEFGVSLNPKLNDRIRSERAPAIFN